MELERIMVRMFADASQYNRVMNAVENRLIGMSRRLSTTGIILQAPIVAATGAVAALSVSTGFASIQAFKLASAYDSARISFEVMANSAERGQQLLDNIVKLGIETPFKSPELLNYGKALMSIGVEASAVVDTLKVLSTVSSAVGMENMPNIVLAYSQVKTAGRLMGQELRQFFNANVPLIEFLAKVRGVPEGSIKGMVERAEISFSDVQKALNLMSQNPAEGGRFGGLMERRMQSVEGRWSAFVETIQVTLREAGLAFFDKFGIAKWLEELTQKMSGGDVRKMFDEFFGGARERIENVARFFRMIGSAVRAAYGYIKDFAEKNKEVLTRVLLIGAAFAGVLVTIQAITVAVAAWPVVLAGIGVALVAVFTDFGDRMLNTFKQAEGFFSNWSSGIREAFAQENWEMVGKFMGLGLKVGLLTVWWSILDEMEWQFLSMFGRIDKFVQKNWAGMRVRWQNFVDAVDPTVSEDQARAFRADRAKKLQIEYTSIDKEVDNVYRKILENQDKSTQRNLAPYRQELEKLQMENFRNKAKMQEEAESPFAKKVKELEDAAGRELYQRIEEGYKTRLLIWGDKAKWTSKQEKEWEDYGKQKEEFFYSKLMGQIAGEQFNQTVAEVQASPEQFKGIPVIPQISAPAQKLAELVKKEMTEGKWAGDALDKYELFQKRMGLLREAYQGPLAGESGFFGPMIANQRMGAVLDKKQYEFGMFEEYTNLRKAIGSTTVNLPSAALRGSQEAQDVINREQIENKSVQEEIRNTLMTAKIIQEQQRDYMKQVVDELKKINGEQQAEQWGGGGDF